VGKVHPGADDNASGAAALLEVAEAMATAKERPKRSVVFLAFTGEELGLLGSLWFVKNPTCSLADVVAMVNLDMVGRYRAAEGLEVGGVGTAAEWKELVSAANKSEEYGFDFRWDPEGEAPTDSTSFFRKKIPVLWFFTGLHADYHTPRDTWDKVDAAAEAKIATLTRDVVVAVADRPERLAFTQPPARARGAALNIAPGAGTEGGVGVVVGEVLEGGAAEKAGIRAGDVVTAIGAYVVANVRDLMAALAAHKPGDSVLVKVQRDGVEQALQVTLGSR
jgi:hypothetical protein